MLLKSLLAEITSLSKNRLEMKIIGSDDIDVRRFNAPKLAQAHDIAFLTDPKYADDFAKSEASVLVLREKEALAIFGESLSAKPTLVICSDPYAFFAFGGQVLTRVAMKPGIDPRAFVEEGAQIDPSATIEALAIVRQGAKIGARTVVKSGAVIGERVTLGDDCWVYSNAVLERDTQVGNRCIFQPGCVIGGDGFGFAPFKGEWIKIPQVGRVVIGDDVEIGANTTIDRGALEDTVIGTGTKLDNLIQIGHNDRIGEHCVMAACVGIAGSTTIGDHVIVGGSAKINGHITIPSQSMVGPASTITGWGTEPAVKHGFFPSMDEKSFHLTAATLSRLPQMRKDIKALERELEALKKIQ